MSLNSQQGGVPLPTLPSPSPIARPTPRPTIDPAPTQTIAAPTPTPATPERTLLLNQLFSVRAGDYEDFNFHLPSRARVVGRFSIRGGLDNGIDVKLFDDQRSYYDSRATGTGAVDVVLQEGDYRLRFDNREARFLGKKVGATFYAFR